MRLHSSPPGTRIRLRQPKHRPIAQGIHVFHASYVKNVDGRVKPGHDGSFVGGPIAHNNLPTRNTARH
jgi:hypothetical protein